MVDLWILVLTMFYEPKTISSQLLGSRHVSTLLCMSHMEYKIGSCPVSYKK